MLDPRIYRMGLVPILLAVMVLAFSLSNQRGPLGTTLAPDAFNGANANANMSQLANLATTYGGRRPGSVGDRRLADRVAAQLRFDQFLVSTDSFPAATVDGPRTLENVVGVRAGQQNGSIVIVAHRDALGSPAKAELSGTAVLLELARVLNGETLQHTVVLASTTGSAGLAGATRLAHTLQQPVDAVIVLGDLAAAAAREPIVVPWSDGQQVAPPLLRNTVAAALGGQAGLPAGSTSLLGQLAHLALPMAASEQAPFGSSGEPAVLLSLSGELAPAAGEPINPSQVTTMGRAALQTISALDGGPSVPAPSRYLGFSGKTVPAWAVRLLVLALILPVLVTTVDGIARARRRGHPILRWVGWALAAALPFVLAMLVVVLGRAVGAIGSAPPGPVGGPAIRLHEGELALLAGLACLIVAGLVWLRPLAIALVGLRTEARGARPQGAGAAAGVLLLLCVIAFALWLANPFAALLVIPALHLWMWVVVPDVRLPVPVGIVLLLAGLALPVLVGVEYATTLGLSPVQAAWSWVLLLAGGAATWVTALEWSIFLGCAVSAVAIAVTASREDRPEPAPVTIRGPITYAGPGSLGGTESALRR
jgi:hypothetical protein